MTRVDRRWIRQAQGGLKAKDSNPKDCISYFLDHIFPPADSDEAWRGQIIYERFPLFQAQAVKEYSRMVEDCFLL